MLVDSHCHLDFPDYADDLDEVIARARDAGVGCMLTISTCIHRFTHVLVVVDRYDCVYCTIGIHPSKVSHGATASATHLVEMACHPKVVGFGETGLDYLYKHNSRADQQRNFRAHIDAARQARLPIVIHSRAADNDMTSILIEEMANGFFAGLLHCFSSGPALASIAIELGLFISISGIVTFRNADALVGIVRDIPLNRLLIETDAPFLTPAPRRGQRNEPALAVQVAARVAVLKGVTLDKLAKATTNNFLNLFTKADSTHFKVGS